MAPIAEIIEEQRRRFFNGLAFLTESMLLDHPEIAAHAPHVVDLLYNEYVIRKNAGETPDEAEFVERFPHLRQEFDKQIHFHRKFDSNDAQQSFRSLFGELAADTPPYVGSQRFQIVRTLGVGSNGVVHLADDMAWGDTVAIKTLRVSSPEALQRIKQEFRGLADLAHPNLVRPYELLVDMGHWLLVMEYVDGINWLSYVRGGASAADSSAAVIPLGEAAQFDRLRSALRQLLLGLDFLHSAGKVHRDIKPSNVLVDRRGCVRILDFGFIFDTRDKRSSAREGGYISGSDGYVAPEAIALEFGPSSDCYAAGAMTYEAILGSLPSASFRFKSTLGKRPEAKGVPVQLPVTVPSDLAEACLGLVEWKSDQRLTVPAALRILGVGSRAVVAIRRADTGELAGRDRERQSLTTAFAQAVAFEATATFVHGSPGSGKSALLAHCDSEWSAAGAIVLHGRCYEREFAPFKAMDPFVEALIETIRHWDTLAAAEICPRNFDALCILFPSLKQVSRLQRFDDAPPVGPDQTEVRRSAFAALVELLQAMAVQRTVVLIVDDIHWADADSLAFFRTLLGVRRESRLLFVGAYRTEERSANQSFRELIDELAAGQGAKYSEIEVGPLSNGDSRTLAARLLGSAGASHEELARLADESCGNPFFLGELVRHYRSDCESIDSSKVSLEEMLGRRIAALKEASRDLVEMAAIAGVPLGRAEVQGLFDDPRSLRPLIHDLRAAGLIRGTSALGDDSIESFHDRVRETALALVDDVRRPKLYRRLAETLERHRPDEPQTLAPLFLGAGMSAKGVEYAARAARRAEDLLAFDQAAFFYRTALQNAPADSADAVAWRRHRAEALANAGRGAEAAFEFLAIADQLETAPSEAAELRRRAAYLLLRSGRIEKGLSTLDIVLRQAGYWPRLPAAITLLQILSLRFYLSLRLRYLPYAPREPIRTDQTFAADVCWAVFAGAMIVDPLRSFRFNSLFALAAMRSGDPNPMGLATVYQSLLARVKNYCNPRARSADLQGLLALRRLGPNITSDSHRRMIRLIQGCIESYFGRWKRCDRRLRRNIEEFRRHGRDIHTQIMDAEVHRVIALVMMGDYGEAIKIGDEQLTAARQRDDLMATAMLTTGYFAVARLIADRPDDVRSLLTANEAMSVNQSFTISGKATSDTLAWAMLELYCGRPEKAWERIEREWKPLLLSFGAVIQFMRIKLHYLRAHCALAMAHAEPAKKDSMLTIARQHVQQLDREKIGWSTPFARMLQGAIDAQTGSLDAARRQFEDAIRRFQIFDMPVYAAAVERRMADRFGASIGKNGGDGAESVFVEKGVRNPQRMIETMVPPIG